VSGIDFEVMSTSGHMGHEVIDGGRPYYFIDLGSQWISFYFDIVLLFCMFAHCRHLRRYMQSNCTWWTIRPLEALAALSRWH